MKEEAREAGYYPDTISGILQESSYENVKDSPAYEGVDTYLKNNTNGRVLMVSMEGDKLVDQAVAQYDDIGKKVAPDRFVHVRTPGGHGSTHPDELRAIREFVFPS